jgi:CheY-like chemotaxis protein
MNPQPSDQPVELLLVEDNLGDVRLIQEAFEETRANVNLHVARDGLEALAFLRQEGKQTQVPRPNLILLDLNLPRKDGRQVLSEIKTNPSLKSIPVLILTTSEAEADIRYAYQFHANCYITKPVDLNQLFEVVKSITHFWLNVVQLPLE